VRWVRLLHLPWLALLFLPWLALLFWLAFASACRPTPKPVKLPATAIDNTVLPGDKFTLQIVGEDKLPTDYEVAADGSVSLPFINTVKVEGLEKHEIENLVRTRLIEGQFYDQPVVVVNIKEFKSKHITVAGEVEKPDSFPFVPGMTLTSAIAKAGGMTPLAIRWEVKLVRKTKTGMVDAIVDYDAINNNEIADVELQPGDKITVPRSPF
jgi:polysaccharide export outer membrane protein